MWGLYVHNLYVCGMTHCIKLASIISRLEVNAVKTVSLGAAGAVEVRNDIGKQLGLELPSTLVFDYPTVSSMCQFISTLAPAVSGRNHSSLRVSRLHLESDPAKRIVLIANNYCVRHGEEIFRLSLFAGRSSEVTREGTAAVIHALVSSLAGADLAPDAPLSQAGLDSLASVELRNELSRSWASLNLKQPRS